MSAKRGIKLQNRIITAAVIMLIQFAFLFFGSIALSKSFFSLYALSEIVGILTVIFILNKRQSPGYKIAWIIFILVLPIFGISVFLLWGGARITPRKKKTYKRFEDLSLKELDKDDTILTHLDYEDYLHSRQARFLIKESGFPIYNHTKCDYLPSGEAFFKSLCEELKKARQYIFLESFILAEGEMWEEIFNILKKKSEENVEIRIMFDDFGSIRRQEKGFIKNIEKYGIKIAVFNMIKPSATIANIFINNRNHQKIVVIDGKVAFTGGVNIADEYINKYERFGHWLDCGAKFEGKAVEGFLSVFCTMWGFTQNSPLDIKKYLVNYHQDSKGFVIPYSDDPLGENNPAEGIYMQILGSAQRYVYITTPYLILDGNMKKTIELAAKSGVDVRIITPHIPDKGYVHSVTRYNYLNLLESGVRIYEYTPGFIHSKLFVSDDRVATVGTVNMDYRSFELHFENGAWVSDTDFAIEIKNNIEEIMEKSQEIMLEDWKKISVFTRIKQGILNVFSPFM